MVTVLDLVTVLDVVMSLTTITVPSEISVLLMQQRLACTVLVSRVQMRRRMHVLYGMFHTLLVFLQLCCAELQRQS